MQWYLVDHCADRQNILEKNSYEFGKVCGHEAGVEEEEEGEKEKKVDTWQGIRFSDNFRIEIALFSISLSILLNPIKSNRCKFLVHWPFYGWKQCRAFENSVVIFKCSSICLRIYVSQSKSKKDILANLVFRGEILEIILPVSNNASSLKKPIKNIYHHTEFACMNIKILFFKQTNFSTSILCTN